MAVYPPLTRLPTRTCNQCGWVHYAVSRVQAQQESLAFNQHYITLSPEQQSHYAGLSTIAQYERCSRCKNAYTNFRIALDSDAPDGCTLGPIIDPDMA